MTLQKRHVAKRFYLRMSRICSWDLPSSFKEMFRLLSLALCCCVQAVILLLRFSICSWSMVFCFCSSSALFCSLESSSWGEKYRWSQPSKSSTKDSVIEIVHPKLNSTIIYSSVSKPVWLTFFCVTEKNIFWRILTTKQFRFPLTSIVWMDK